jgi:hypothetical protein
VDAHVVNAALVAAINRLGPLDFVAEGGDIANREENEAGAAFVQSAAASWGQFAADYIAGLTVTTSAGAKAPLYIVPGNHDVSNAIGFYKAMQPLVDKTALVEIYNRMLRPTKPRSLGTYEYSRDRVLYSHDVGGVHFVFLTIWPDSIARAWMERDLTRISATTPVVIVTHDQPQAQAKHFTNPNGNHTINETDRFENLLSDTLADGSTVDAPTLVEQRALEAFLLRHRNITAYFHGNSDWNEFYDWNGPDHLASLHVFRVDSPMKGAQSADDESRLSFHVAAIDAVSHALTVRECLWNLRPTEPTTPCVWGDTRTVDLLPMPQHDSRGPGTQ